MDRLERLLVTAPGLTPLELLIVQPTNFCNLDCSYCYLPGRSAVGLMSDETLANLAIKLFRYPHLGHRLSIVWHAGEPLVAPLSFYERAFDLFDRYADGHEVVHTIQTNGTLLTEEHCRLFKRRNVRIGLSLDGPAFIHDRCRTTRKGTGSHALAVRAARLLQNHAIPLYAIAVVTECSLDHADELYDFFISQRIFDLGLNLAEVEGLNTSSTVLDTDNADRVADFLATFASRVIGDSYRLRWRELRGFVASLSGDEFENSEPGQTARPGAIINVARDGGLSTFSPELLRAAGAESGLRFGNVNEIAIEDMFDTPEYAHTLTEIDEGLRACESQCGYWSICKGGSPSNKFWENGTMASAETRYCKASFQTLADVLTESLSVALDHRSSAAIAR